MRSRGDLVRLRFQSLVARGLSSSEVAARVGLVAASEVWGGAAPRDRPAWYLWLRGAPGAWQLELAGAEHVATGGVAATMGRFTVRHYPSPAGAVFGAFSPDEREMAIQAFDATGTPRIEVASRIPDAAFTVGSIDWAIGGDAAVVALSSLDRLRTRTERGELVRDVPGWQLTAPMFTLVAGLHAQLERQSAARLVVARQPGFELVASEHGLAHGDSTDAIQGEALLLLSRRGVAPALASRLMEALRDPAAELVADASFASCAPPPDALAPEPRLPVPVSPAWFGGDEHLEDRVACAC